MDENGIDKIREEAKRILDKFSASLEKVKLKEKATKKIVGGYREESQANESNSDFRKRMFDNASNKNEECIIAESKKW